MTEYPLQQLAEDIAASIAPPDFDSAARRELRSFDELNGRIMDKTGVKLACREGCSLCCWLRVDLFAHEVLLIAHHIRSNFTEQQMTRLMNNLEGHSAKVVPLTTFEHATQNIPCPLLQDGRCSIYSVRPHSCRRHHSHDFVACQFTFDHPRDLDFPGAHHRELFQTLTEAMRDGIEVYAQLGFDHTIYELGTALHEALVDPHCWTRWRNHEQTFLRASVTPAA